MDKLKWMNKLKKELKKGIGIEKSCIKGSHNLKCKFNWLDWESYYKDGYSPKEAAVEDFSYS